MTRPLVHLPQHYSFTSCFYAPRESPLSLSAWSVSRLPLTCGSVPLTTGSIGVDWVLPELFLFRVESSLRPACELQSPQRASVQKGPRPIAPRLPGPGLVQVLEIWFPRLLVCSPVTPAVARRLRSLCQTDVRVGSGAQTWGSAERPGVWEGGLQRPSQRVLRQVWEGPENLQSREILRCCRCWCRGPPLAEPTA